MLTDVRKSLSRRISSCIRSLLSKGKTMKEAKAYVRMAYGVRDIIGK